MSFDFHPEAELEFFEAIAYYDRNREDLGLEFAREIFSTINRIVRFPTAYPAISNQHRRCLVKRFPYGIIYEIIGDEIFILVVMHLSRDNEYWKTRLMP